jgi:tetratricopeptide (TPR) repeat protein
VQNQREAALRQFSTQAKIWREALPKPVMPESAREHQVLAEYAFKQRETQKAIHEYQAAVTEFPTWPEGQFNLATLAGEQRDYDTACLHMSEYLELAPDSTDAQAAKDSIIIWKDRLSVFGSLAKVPAAQVQNKGKM